jgi:enamine deaminase RidA (YjgF/YER057c/UK114 family)
METLGLNRYSSPVCGCTNLAARVPVQASPARRRTRAVEGETVPITVVKSGIPRPLANYNEAFVVGDLVFAAGQIASDFKTGVPPQARKKEGFPFYGSDIELQTAYILENLKQTFEAAGSSLDHVVKAQVFLTDLANFHGFDSVWKRYFKQPPPRTTIGCTGLLVEDTLVEIDLIGYVPRKGFEHRVITSSVPRPLANYNEAFVIGDLVFAAGQLASDFKTGVPPQARKREGFPFYGSDIELQTAYVLENLKKTFEAAGSSLDHVVKAQVFLTDLNNFHGFDSVWKRYFKEPPPRTTIGCTGLLVEDTLVEIDLIGYVPKKGLKRELVTSSIPRPLANYNEAFVVGDRVFAAGQLASDFKTGVPPQARKKPGFPFYGSDIELQTAYVLENLKKTFEAAGSALDQVIKAQVFLTDLDNFHGFDTVWKRYFKRPPPRTTIGCSGLLVQDTLVEIDLIGTKG